MYYDEFKTRYTTVPFATFKRDHKKGEEKKDIVTLLHSHRETEIVVVFDGRAKMSIDGISYDVKKGDVVIIPPYGLHSATIFKDRKFRHFCMCFDLSLLCEEKFKEKIEKGIFTPVKLIEKRKKANEEITEFLKKAYTAHEEQKYGWELEVKGCLCAFFGILFKNGYIKEEKSFLRENDINYKITDLIEKNYKEKLTSADMAKKLYVSESWFCRIFKKNFGNCFQNYLCMYRIEKAKILLKTTQMSVSDISAETGFNSFSFFGKMFKKYVGVTPSQYRKN